MSIIEQIRHKTIGELKADSIALMRIRKILDERENTDRLLKKVYIRSKESAQDLIDNLEDKE